MSNSDNASDGFDWGGFGGTLLAGGIPLIGSLFSKKIPGAEKEIAQTEKQAGELGTEGKGLAGSGKDALGPVMKYFEALASGDPSAALAATAPQRGRVMDQYDAARRSAGQFGPRGGGNASSQLELRGKEAGQLADTTSQARSEGADKLAALGSDLTKTGISEEEASARTMASVIEPILKQQEHDQEQQNSFWGGLGKLASSALKFFL
jgi:hypothetical protein